MEAKETINRHEALTAYLDPENPVGDVVERSGLSARTLSRMASASGQKRPIKGGSRPLKKGRNIAQVLRLYEDGLTVEAIAKSLPEKVNPQTIGVWLRDEGLAARYETPDRKGVKEERERKRAQFLEAIREKTPITEAAEAVGINKSTAYRWVRSSGLDHQTARRAATRSPERVATASQLHEQGRSIQEIAAEIGCDYYVAIDLLKEAGIEVSSSATGRTCPCGNTTGSGVANYCSVACRKRYGAKRQADPSKQVTFNCETCGKEVTRWKGYGGGANRFCSNTCAAKHTKTVRHYMARDSDVVLDSTWEMLFYSTLAFLKIPVERTDREQGVEWTEGNWYSPDFHLPSLGLWIEVKGQEAPEDVVKWAAFRKRVGLLAVLDKDGLEAIRSLDRTGVETYLKEQAESR